MGWGERSSCETTSVVARVTCVSHSDAGTVLKVARVWYTQAWLAAGGVVLGSWYSRG
jgi:hypothetical protein